MSAPETNLERQKSRHRPALFGIGLAVGFAAVLLTALVVYVFAQGDAPEGADQQIDARTGEVVDGD